VNKIRALKGLNLFIFLFFDELNCRKTGSGIEELNIAVSEIKLFLSMIFSFAAVRCCRYCHPAS
jgi:hypothetical protein